MSRPDRAALAFQDDLDRLQAEPAPRGLRAWPWFAALFLIALTGLAASLRIDIVVLAQGRLAAAAPSVTLKPAAAAILQELAVRPGDVVVAGQILARLDPTFAAADLAALQAERSALVARITRLTAERDGTPLDLVGPAAESEVAVLAERRAVAAAERAALQAEIAAITEMSIAEAEDGPGLTEQLAVLRDVEVMRATLAERQSGSHLAEMEARLMRLRAEADSRRHLARLAELDRARAQAQTRLAAFEAELRRAVTEALAEARPRLAVVEEELAKAQSLRAMTDLVAPRPGVVLSVAEGGPGTLIAAGEAVVVLVPTDVPLLAEIGLRSGDAGRVVSGDPVVLKIDAFPWRRHGSLAGELTDVGHASFTPDGSPVALHPGHVRLTEAEPGLRDLATGMTLLPGMTLTAEIRTGTRSLLDLLLDPVMRGLQESFREP